MLCFPQQNPQKVIIIHEEKGEKWLKYPSDKHLPVKIIFKYQQTADQIIKTNNGQKSRDSDTLNY